VITRLISAGTTASLTRTPRSDPHQNGTEYTYRDVVGALKTETEVRIMGDVGERLAQGMGADIRHLGGTGRIGTGTAFHIFVDGNVGAEAGLGMVAGSRRRLEISSRCAPVWRDIAGSCPLPIFSATTDLRFRFRFPCPIHWIWGVRGGGSWF